jgi:ankyrin
VQLVRDLIAQGLDPQIRSSKGNSALHLAAKSDCADACEILLSAGVPIDTPGEMKAHALHFAACSGGFESARSLLRLGASASATDADGKTPLHKAAEKQNLECVNLLLENAPGILELQDRWEQTALHLAASVGDTDIVERLLAGHANIEARDSWGQTPLMVASAAGQMEAVMSLLEHGASITTANNNGATALHVAAEQGHIEIIGLLIDRGASLTANDIQGRCPLHVAAAAGHEVRILSYFVFSFDWSV